MALQLKQIPRLINAGLLKVTDKRILKAIGIVALEMVRDRTRKGFGVKKEGGAAKRLNPLTSSTKATRRRLQKRGKLSENTSPTKSNLTSSGDMLDDLKLKVGKTSVTISIDGKDRQKAERVQNQGREFMNLSKKEINKIVKIIQIEINDIFKSL